MTVLKTAISWAHSTANFWVGCVAVSAGCDNCYARALVDVRYAKNFGHPFEQVKLHMHRLADIRKMRPVGDKPHRCFVNSMSDFFLDQVDDRDIHACLDAFEQNPDVVFMALTKRPVRMRSLLAARYRGAGIPDNMWFGVSTEDNRVAARLNILRRLKEQVGQMTAFVSVEPIIGPTDKLNFAGIDWAITGGESGLHARVMERGWLLPAIEHAQAAGAAIWHKQSGQPRSHPNWDHVPRHFGVSAGFLWLQTNGWEMLPEERGGATIDKRTYRQLPPAYERIAARLGTVGKLL